MESGLVIRDRQGYILREASLQTIIKDIQRDMLGLFAELEDVAKDIDDRLGS